MAVYLIDFENVNSAGLSGIQQLTKEDKVYIFYTVNATSISFTAHMNILSSPAEVIYYYVTSGGKDALDFQLVSFLGYLISEGKSKEFCIISNDRGYYHVKNFWEKSGLAEGVKIYSASSINRFLTLMSAENPFSVKIQQADAQQSTVPAVQPVQVSAETEKCIEERSASETAVITADVKSEEKETVPEEADAEKAVKRRGRPRKQPVEVTETAEEAVKKTAEIHIIADELPAETKKKKPKIPKKYPKPVNKEAALTNLRKAIRPLLEEVGICSSGDMINIANHMKSADGKQQFYCRMTKSYGMEKGLAAYNALRTEYANLIKLVK